jgi:hypothetical protein
MRRLLSAVSGLLLIVVAFLAAARVADTREGLIAEVVTLMSGLAGVGLLLFGLVPKRQQSGLAARARATSSPRGPRTANDLVLGVGGIVIGAVLLAGLAESGGWGWAAMGGALLVPMLAGSAYLIIAFARAPEHDWRVDLRRLFRLRTGD